MPGFLDSDGMFVMLQASSDHDWLDHPRYQSIEGPKVPAKNWAPGQEWWLNGKRKNGET